MSDGNEPGASYGVFPGAREWTESADHGSWYRELGDWAALVYPDRKESRWRMRVWLRHKRPDEGGNAMSESSIGYFSIGGDPQSLDMARGTCDRILANRAGLKYAAEALREIAAGRDNAADPETRGLRYAAGQLDVLAEARHAVPSPRPQGTSIALRNNGNDGFAAVSERRDGTVQVEVEISPGHSNRVAVAVNGSLVWGLETREDQERQDA
jgi:hypothetical protein